LNIIDRFKNQRVSQLIHLKNKPPFSLPSRIENCHRLKRDRSIEVMMKKNPGSERAHYSTLQTCGSVWSCPVCSSIISEHRRDSLQTAFDLWRSFDSCNTIIMITFTTPHYLYQSLDEVLKLQDDAIRIMQQQKQRGKYKVWRTIMDEMEMVGYFTGREMTFGSNGWHPHRHTVYFTLIATQEQLKRWQNELSVAFLFAFQKVGGLLKDAQAFMQRAVRLDQINDDDGYNRIASYVTTVEGETWTLAREATKGITKTAKNGNITPFGMLQSIREGHELSRFYSAKFYEYVSTMKGKKQFFPSPGLRKILQMNWKTDEEIIQELKGGNIYASLSDSIWNEINIFNIKGEIIELSKIQNEFAFLLEVERYLSEINQKTA